jgi:predicted MFS family arabinose efflux permease
LIPVHGIDSAPLRAAEFDDENEAPGCAPLLTDPGDSSRVTILIKSPKLARTSPKLRPREDILRRPLTEWLLLLMLAAVQFTVAVDFVIMMPLGPQLVRIFSINTPAFNLAVSAYAAAAGLSGICGALFLDRFDRKTALLTIYAGFTIGTLFCGLAPTYWTLVLARAFAGCFGGIVGGISLAIVGDLVPEARRASAMGTVMSAFSVAQVAGIPLGLYLADQLSWHVPFVALAGLSAVIWVCALFQLPKVRAHLALSRSETAFHRFAAILFNRDHLRALAFMAVITMGGFMIIPDLATYLVNNVGLSAAELRWVYLVGGAATLFTMNGVGRLADRFGRMRMFGIMMMFSMAAAFLITHLPVAPVALVVATSTFFMISMTGRFVPAITMVTSSVNAVHRGGFMSINSSVAQFSGAIAAALAGCLIHDGPKHQLIGFGLVGWAYLGWAVIGLWLGGRVRAALGGQQAVPAAEAA